MRHPSIADVRREIHVDASHRVAQMEALFFERDEIAHDAGLEQHFHAIER